MARKNTKTTLSVSEFRSWLEGVEDMQADDWSPDLSQWKKIRSKIEMLEEVDYTEIVADLKQNQPKAPAPVITHRPAPIANTSSFLDDTPSPKLSTVMPSPPQSIIGSTKTPDIDTSVGPYPSAFV